MPFFDSHCHLDFDAFADPQLIIDEAKAQGVTHLLVPSIGQANWQAVQALSERFDNVYHALGLHPYFIDCHDDNVIEKLEASLLNRHQKCVAVGECGLDFALDDAILTPQNREKQHLLFTEQVKLAKALKLPLIIHSRKAHAQVLAVLKKHQPSKGGVIHAFAGSEQQALDFIKLGFYIGVGGIITYPRANKTRQAIANLPLDKLILETDAPDMPISGKQGEANHPKYIPQIFNALCQLRNESGEVIAEQVWENGYNLFRIYLNNNPKNKFNGLN